MLEPQSPDYLEKLAESLLYNFHREHLLLKLKLKKLLRKISSKNFTAGVFFPSFLVSDETAQNESQLIWHLRQGRSNIQVPILSRICKKLTVA